MSSPGRLGGRGAISPADTTLEARIGRRIAPQANGCWLWTGATSQDYGLVVGVGRAHRVVYEILVGPIPEDHVLHHRCETKACVNPEHLEPMLPGDHISLHRRSS